MTASVGDWSLTFGLEATALDQLPTRHGDAGWQSTEQQDGAVLATRPAGESWKGAPWQRFDNADWRVWLLGECFPQTRDLAERCLDVVAGGLDPSTLNGHFLILARHLRSGRWHVLTDRFGTLHAYRATDGRKSAVGTFFPAVAAAASRRRLDWQGLTGFCACGFFPADRTPFEDTRILRPSTRTVLDQDGNLLSSQRYWQWRHEPETERSWDDTLEHFAELLDRVVADLGQGRTAVPISGGLDSRSLVSALPDGPGAEQVTSYSYGYDPGSAECRIARRVAGAQHLPFEAFTIEPYLFDRLDLVSDSVEGFQDLTQCRQASIVDELAPRADYVLAGHWGDVWLDSMGAEDLDESSAALHKHVKHRMVKRGRRWLLEHLCRPQLEGSSCDEVLDGWIRTGLDEVAEVSDRDFRVKAFKTDHWSFRFTTASLRMYQPAAFPRLPFYDTRLSDFFATVPSHFMRGRSLQIAHLKRFHPDLACITCDAFDTNLYRAAHFRAWSLPRRVARRLWRVIARKQILERNWEVQFAGDQGRRGLRRWLLRRGLRLHDFVSPREVRTLLDTFHSSPPDGGLGHTVAMLFSFSVWLESHV